MCGREHSLQLLTPIPLHPPNSQNARYELFKLGHFPGSVHCCSVHIRSSRLQKQWIEGARLWRISAYSTRFVASYQHPSTSYKTMHIACQSPKIAPSSNNPWRRFRLHTGERVRQILRPCGGGVYPIGDRLSIGTREGIQTGTVTSRSEER